MKLWLTSYNHCWAILWYLCSPTAPGKVVISKFLSALPQIVPSFEVHRGQGALQLRENQILLSQGVQTGYFHLARSSADLGLLLQLGAGQGAQAAPILTRAHAPSACSLAPSFGGQHSGVENMPLSCTFSKLLPVGVVYFVHALSIQL